MNKLNLILLRGVSGAGKSTVAELFIDATIISTDDFFIQKEWCTICDDGEPVDAICNEDHNKYIFDANSLVENHMKCTVKAEQAMGAATRVIDNPGLDIVNHTLVIHNTFTKQWEMTPYLILAEKYGYTVHTLIVENRHESKSIHNVPQHSVDAQRRRFEVVL
tara:strand:+ start:106 stop:594 length:489 start_codon:yes stop_codon:yes gene_type:complete